MTVWKPGLWGPRPRNQLGLMLVLVLVLALVLVLVFAVWAQGGRAQALDGLGHDGGRGLPLAHQPPRVCARPPRSAGGGDSLPSSLSPFSSAPVSIF